MSWSDNNIPDIDRNQPLINGPQDLDRIKTPDFDNGRGRKIVDAKRAFPGEATGLQPTLGFCAPFSFAANVRGIEPLLLDLYTDPGFARELFTRATENVIAPWILYQKEHFPDAVSITGSDATASLPIVSPDILREWINSLYPAPAGVMRPGTVRPQLGWRSVSVLIHAKCSI